MVLFSAAWTLGMATEASAEADRAEAAAAAARGGSGGTRVVDLSRTTAPRPNAVRTLPEDVAKGTKVELLARADQAARATGGAISQVMVRYGDSRRRILVANSDGLLTGDDQVRTLFSVSCVANGDTGLQTGRESIGKVTRSQVREIAETKMADLNANDIESAARIVEGTARSLGI